MPMKGSALVRRLACRDPPGSRIARGSRDANFEDWSGWRDWVPSDRICPEPRQDRHPCPMVRRVGRGDGRCRVVDRRHERLTHRVAARLLKSGVSTCARSRAGELENQNAPFNSCGLDGPGCDACCACDGPGQPILQHAWPEHRREYPDVPGLRAGARLPGLLHAWPGHQSLLLRRHVLAARGRQLVREHLVQRALAERGRARRAAVRAARARALLPQPAGVLPRLAGRRAATLG